MQDRPYQLECEEAILTNFDKNVRRQLANLATGTGKTVIFSKLYERIKSRLPGQMLVIAHREELIKQAIDKLRLINPDIMVDEERAEEQADPTTADIIVASVASLGRKGTKRVEKYNWNNFDKLIVDEAHHSTADSYKNIFKLFGVGVNDRPKLLLGVTATPQRSDGKAMADIYEKIVYVYGMRQAIEDGWLVDVKGFRVSTQTDLSQVHTVAGDFAQGELADTVNTPARNRVIVDTWKKYGEERQTVAFTVDIQHAKDLAEAFQEQGVNAEAIWGDDPEREEKLAAHRKGEISVLCNCGVLTEGYDDWRIGCIILARPTKSGVLFTQMVGRATRLEDGTGNLIEYKKKSGVPSIKDDCLIFDVVDMSGKHSLVTLPTLMGLQGNLDLRGKSLVGSLKLIEDAQKEHPSIDFTKLTDISQLKAMIEAVNMFDVRFPEEVEANSELMWFRAAGGGYRMNLRKSSPEGQPGFVRIYQNLLDKWEIVGEINSKQFHGMRNSMEEAFKVADEQVRQRVSKMVLSCVKREATWHKNPATEAQFVLLKKFYPWQTFPKDISRGQASKLISEKLAGKAKKK